MTYATNNQPLQAGDINMALVKALATPAPPPAFPTIADLLDQAAADPTSPAAQIVNCLNQNPQPTGDIPPSWQDLRKTATDLAEIEKTLCDLRSQRITAWKKFRAALENLLEQ